MVKVHILVYFLFFCSLCFSQFKVNDVRDEPLVLDLVTLETEFQDKDKISVNIFYLDALREQKIIDYTCLKEYDVELFEFTIYNTLTSKGDAKELVIKSKEKNKIKVEKENMLRSMLYFTIDSTSILINSIEKNLEELDIKRIYTCSTMLTYKLEGIANQEVFCWKLNRLIKFIEAHKELLNKTDDESSNFNIQFQSSGLYGIAPKIRLKNSFYSSNHNVQSMMGIDFKVMGFYNIPDKYGLGFGLGFSRTYVTTTNSIENQSYSTTWTHPQLQGDQIKNVYLNDVVEQSDLTLNTLNVPLSLRYKCNNKLNFQLNITPSFVLPSNITSRITSGNISYRGQVEGIDDELYNISELGLFDNISLNQSTTQKYSGWGIEFGGNISHVFKTGSVFIGVGYNFQRLKSDFSNERLHLSSDVTHYNSSFSSADGFSLSAIMLNTGISINLNSSEK